MIITPEIAQQLGLTPTQVVELNKILAFINVKSVSELSSLLNPVDGNLIFEAGDGKLYKVPINTFYQLIGGLAKPISPGDATPTITGWYKPRVYSTTPGTNYPNLTNLKAVKGFDTLFYFDGNTWVDIANEMPTKPVTPSFDRNNNTEAQGGKQISDFIAKEAFQKGFRRTGNLFKKSDFKSGFYLDLDGVEHPNVNFGYSGLIAIKPDTYYSQNVTQIRNFYDVNGDRIVGIGDSENTWKSPVNADYVSLVVALPYLETFAFVEGTTISSDLNFTEATIEGILTPVYKRIEHSNTSYNAIRTLAEKLYLQADYYNRYEIHIAEGTYTESDWKGFGKYVKIRGYNRDNCIIQFNGNSTQILPADYSFPTEAGKAANTVVKGLKHIVFLSRDIYCENLTFDAISCKYPIHPDNPNYKKGRFINCWIKESDCNYPVGIGIWSGQELVFDKCILERAHYHIPMRAILYHNTFNQKLGSKVEFLNCSMIQCGGAVVYENGSNNEDILNITNCVSDSVFEIEYGVSQDGDSKTFWINNVTGVKEPNPANIPYNIKLNTIGSDVDFIYSSQNFVGFTSARPLFYKHITSDYFGLAKALEPVVKGDLISEHGDGDYITTKRVKVYKTAVLSLPPIGVALHNAALNEMVYFSKAGKVSYIKCDGEGISVWDANTKKLIFNEMTKVFESKISSSWKSADAIALKRLPDNGLLAATLRMK